MSIIAHACAPVNVAALVATFRDSVVLAGSPHDVEYDAILRAEANRRGLDLPGVVCDYEPSADELAELHGGDHDAAPGDPDDLHVISQAAADYHDAEAELAEWAAEREAMVAEAEGYGWRELICQA